MQVTNSVGGIALESPDGRDLYYIEAADGPSAVWHLPLTGGAAVKVVEMSD